ncbi:uncharacterized protein EKO05_0007474 [Ascochyta rabiei]|uniref:Uncharacterized protein n=1 Tax=Didymella rabiei TaxID=5454 RepID=A0A162YLZ6_DIDRA|nr:uncharacterized protein EKO05_0007474 [Ascochyta rabiei]KZM20119.1 hypothetical protein ST47_g8736 [Ascochyta rabiei]UPX17098.1 hypothetical protein EKO05_0007474 [Ascochyta rabiei]
MRVTRAAQRAQQDNEEPVEAPELDGRVLKDIEPNVSSTAQAEEPLPAKTPAKTPAKKGKGRGAKKSAKVKNAKTEEDELAQFVEGAEHQAAASPEDREADQDLQLEHKDETVQSPDTEDESKAPQTPAVRLTRRQLAKLEEEALSKSRRAPSSPPPEEATITNATKTPAVYVPEEPIVDSKQEAVAEKDEVPTAHEKPTNVDPESAPKPVRLTRRQQARLEEESKRLQAEQPPPQPERTEEEALQDIVTKAQVEAVVEQEREISEESVVHEAINIGEGVVPVAAADERPCSPKEVTAGPQADEEIEVEVLEKNQVLTSQTSEAAKVEEKSTDIIEAAPATPTEARFKAKVDTPLDNTLPDEATPVLEISLEAEPKMLTAEKPFEVSVTTRIRSPTSHRRASRSLSKSPMRLEESISAIDRLEEDLEDIGKAIPDFDHTDDEKLPRKPQPGKATATPLARGKTPSQTPARTPARTSAKTATRTPAKATGKTPSKTPVKAPTLAKAPAAAEAPVPTRISRLPSAAPKGVKPTTTSLARTNSVRTAPNKDIRKPLTDSADYLASKRRPISLSFPTPPPPPKGKAPTKPTFQLSSDNIAAKLKAQKEERLKRETERVTAPKQRPISMPPPAKSTKPPTVPSFQLPGEATAARLKAQKEERLKRMEEAGGAEKPTTRPISMPPPPKSTKPPTKPSFQLPGEATAARLKAQKEERLKRMEDAEAAKKAAAAAPVRRPMAHRPRESLLVRDAPGVSIPPPSIATADAPQRSTSLASKRSSITGPSVSRSTSTSSAKRNSLLLTAGARSTVTPVDAAALKVKGKQVFNRDRVEKETVERERKEKEDAAKRARAEAAERGRIASREWAERQRKKMMGQ